MDRIRVLPNVVEDKVDAIRLSFLDKIDREVEAERSATNNHTVIK